MQHLPLPASTTARHPARRVLVGLAVIAFGVLALLDQQRLFDVRLLSTFWPLVLVLVGVARLAGAPRAHGLSGTVLIVIGGLFMARNLGYTGFAPHQWWPVFVILGGLSMLLRGVWTDRKAD